MYAFANVAILKESHRRDLPTDCEVMRFGIVLISSPSQPAQLL